MGGTGSRPWRREMPLPRQMVPTFPTSLPFLVAAQSPPCRDLSSLFTAQMNFEPRRSPPTLSWQCPAWCPPQQGRPQSIHSSAWLYQEPTAPRGFPLLSLPSRVLGHASGCESLFLPPKNTSFSFPGQLGRKPDQQQGSQSAGQVAAGEQEPDSAGVSVPLRPLLPRARSPLGALPRAQQGRTPPALTELGRLPGPQRRHLSPGSRDSCELLA